MFLLLITSSESSPDYLQGMVSRSFFLEGVAGPLQLEATLSRVLPRDKALQQHQDNDNFQVSYCLFLFIIFLLIIWKVHIMHPDSHFSQVHFPIITPPPYTHIRKKKNMPSPVCVSHILIGAGSNSQCLAP